MTCGRVWGVAALCASTGLLAAALEDAVNGSAVKGCPCRRMDSVACWPWLAASEVTAKARAASAACLSWASRP
eukprot:14581473-Alexandrium_andersonii.AAC.1